jgi:hypothetical protein
MHNSERRKINFIKHMYYLILGALEHMSNSWHDSYFI